MLKVATVFSGIGAIEQALKRMNLEHEIVFACDNGNINVWKNKTEEEKEKEKEHIHNIKNHQEKKKHVDQLYTNSRKVNFVKESYFSNYDITEEKWYSDVEFLDGNPYRGKVDLFVGGSPCQSFSMVGKRLGLEDTRGTLFYQYARLVKEIQPKVFIYENVKGLLNHDKGNTWRVIQNIFDDLGYHWKMKVLTAKDYGIPQSRDRVFVVGFKENVDFEFPKPIPLKTVLKDYLEEQVDSKYYLGPKGILSVTEEKTMKKKYTQINGEIALCQTANQQFNWKGDFIYEGEGGIENITIDSKVRKLTPKECLRMMGFGDDFKQVVSDMQLYRQSGNSIVVDVLMAMMTEIHKTNVF